MIFHIDRNEPSLNQHEMERIVWIDYNPIAMVPPFSPPTLNTAVISTTASSVGPCFAIPFRVNSTKRDHPVG
jgi:hypothetical protein